MNSDRSLQPIRSALGATLTVAVAALAFGPSSVLAQKTKNPSSKVYVSDVNGAAQIDTGDNIQDLNKKAVYNAEGTTIETKRSENGEDTNKVFATSVFSNGTGAYFDQDTKVEVKKFVQEPFTPNRTDMDVEPSISETQAVVARGTVGLCGSKPVAGSKTNFSTSMGSIGIRGGKIVIEANDNETKVSMLEGDSTVRGGDLDMAGNQLTSGKQAIIRRGRAGQPNQVIIQDIPRAEVAALDDKVAMACMAKKTVYFEVRERPADSTEQLGSTTSTADVATTKVDAAPAAEENTASGGAVGVSPAPPISAFDAPVANSRSTNPPPTIIREIVPVQVVPVSLPVEYTVSPARIVNPKPKG